MRDSEGDHYFIDKDDVELTEIPYEESIIYVDDKAKLFESTKHIGVLNYFMQDAPEFQSRIENLKKPGHKGLIKLAEDYHNVVCKDEQCVIYEKPVPFIKIKPEVFVGMNKYLNVRDFFSQFNVENTALINEETLSAILGSNTGPNKAYNTNFHVNAGIIAHIWLPRASENLYFKTGLIYSQLQIKERKKTLSQDYIYVLRTLNYFKLPLQIEYVYPKGVVRPRIAYGPVISSSKQMTVSCDVGANIRLSDSFFITATSDFEFNPTVVIFPKSLFTYSLRLGVLYNI